MITVPTAELLPAQAAARIAAVLDNNEILIERDGLCQALAARVGIVLIDEGDGADEHAPDLLISRVAFHLEFGSIEREVVAAIEGSITISEADRVAAARERLAHCSTPSEAVLGSLAVSAVRLGIDDLVAPILALRCAQVNAAFEGRMAITTEDIEIAARLVFAPRARTMPRSDDEKENTPPPESEPPESQEMPKNKGEITVEDLTDIVVEAAATALPDGLIAELAKGAITRSLQSGGRGAGATKSDPKRGRPAGVRIGSLGRGARLALLPTLRAAAPWQKIRRQHDMPFTSPSAPSSPASSSGTSRVYVRREDFRIQKFVAPRESTIIFCVDASGSSAFHRLGEVKGAVELLLADAYVTRTYAALIAFRGVKAEILLPPTRSLARAKMVLAQLPGGGGTPLASGLESSLVIALAERKKGRGPLVVVLTDGRANIARDGSADRRRAVADAHDVAGLLKEAGIPSLLLDASTRPGNDVAELAEKTGGRYVPMPGGGAHAVRGVVKAAVDHPS
jgi:magnesium chelatase subunit D